MDDSTDAMMMAFDGDQQPVGLLMSDDSGLYTRADTQWFAVTPDNTNFDGVEVINVDPDFLDFFDKLDSKGSEPTYKQAQSYAVPDQETEA